MKTRNLYLIAASLSSFLFVSCINYEIILPLPTVTTNDISNISESSASCGGDVTKDGGSLIIARGLCWDTVPNPTVRSNKEETMGCEGEYEINLTNLHHGKTYYVRAYAENMSGIAYGSNKKFSTIGISIETIIEGKSGVNSMITGGKIKLNPSVLKGNIIHKQGLCYANHPNPTTKDMISQSGNLTEDCFYVRLDRIECGTNYYVKAYVTTYSGMTYYGDEQIVNTDVLFGN